MRKMPVLLLMLVMALAYADPPAPSSYTGALWLRDRLAPPECASAHPPQMNSGLGVTETTGMCLDYSTAPPKIKCYQAGEWVECGGSSAGGASFGQAYTICNAAGTVTCDYATTDGDLGDAINTALAAHPSSAGSPVTLIVLAGQYNDSTGANLTGQNALTIASATPEGARVTISSTLFSCVGNCYNVTIAGFYATGSNKFVSWQPKNVAGYTLSLVNNHMRANLDASTSSGLLYAFGDDTFPGPVYTLSGNTCESSHFCIDAYGNGDTDSDGTTDSYYQVYSSGNTYRVSNNYIPPVYFNGPTPTVFMSGDTITGDCAGIGIAAGSITGTPPVGYRNINISGGSIYIGQTGTVRKNCSTYPNGPSAITIGGDALSSDATTDNTNDNIVVQGTAIYVQKDTVGGGTHSAFYHRGTNAIPTLNFTAASDNTSGWVVVRPTTAKVRGLYAGMNMGTVIYPASGQRVIIHGGASGGTAMTNPPAPTIGTMQIAATNPSPVAQPYMQGTASSAYESWLLWGSKKLHLFAGESQDAAVGIQLYTPGDGGFDLIPEDIKGLGYIGTTRIGTTTARWTELNAKTLDLSYDGTSRGTQTVTTLGGRAETWIDLNHDGTPNVGDQCITSSGFDLDCDGTEDIAAPVYHLHAGSDITTPVNEAKAPMCCRTDCNNPVGPGNTTKSAAAYPGGFCFADDVLWMSSHFTGSWTWESVASENGGTAGLASALTNDPSACAAGKHVSDIAADLTLTCTDDTGGTGDVTIDGTPAANQIARWSSATAIKGTNDLTYDDTTFSVGGTGLITLTDQSSTPGAPTSGDTSWYSKGGYWYSLDSDGTGYRMLEQDADATLTPSKCLRTDANGRATVAADDCNTGGTGIDHTTTVDLWEEFFGGGNATDGKADVGELNWRFNRANAAETVNYGGATGHPGNVVLNTSTGATDQALLFKSSANSTPFRFNATAATYETVLQLGAAGQAASSKVVLGLSASSSGCSYTPVNGIIFYSDGGGNWTGAGCASSTCTTAASSVANDGSWVHLKIVADSTIAHFYVNGTEIGTGVTTNLPAAGTDLDWTYQLCNASGAARQLRIDQWHFTQTVTAR